MTHFKCIILTERSQTEKVADCMIYKTFWKRQTIGLDNRSVLSWGQELTAKKQDEGTVLYLTVVVVIQLYASVKAHRSVNQKGFYCM